MRQASRLQAPSQQDPSAKPETNLKLRRAKSAALGTRSDTRRASYAPRPVATLTSAMMGAVMEVKMVGHGSDPTLRAV